MKYTILILVAILSVFGCTQSNKNPEKNIKDSIDLSDTLSYKMESFFLTEKDCNKDTCDAYVAAKYPVFLNNEINDFVLKTITPAPLKDNYTSSLALAADSFINEYLDYKNEFPDSPIGYHWDQTLIVTYQNKDFISFNHTTYGYTGGAHGMQTTLFYNINRKNNTAFTLADLLVDDYEVKLNKIGEDIFRKNEGIKETGTLEDYFFEDNKFVLNNNFLITPKGLLFLYNQYEIKAYVYGTTELLIPYDTINSLISDNSILQKFK